MKHELVQIDVFTSKFYIVYFKIVVDIFVIFWTYVTSVITFYDIIKREII